MAESKITIYSKDGIAKISVPISEKDIYRKELMTEEYVSVCFDSPYLVNIEKADYVATEFGTFKVWKINAPKQDSKSRKWTYEQKFHAEWHFWSNHILMYDRQNAKEVSWSLTQKPEYFLDIIVSNLQSLGFGTFSYEVEDADIMSQMKALSFDQTDIVSALTQIAEAWESEWWIDTNTIHLSRCEYGSAVALKENDHIAAITDQQSKDDYCTRLYAFGSTRNLVTNYRKDESSSDAIEAVVERRLKLPAGTPYVDAWEDMADEDIVEGVMIDDAIYPRRTGTIATIGTKQYTDEVTDEDTGETTYEKWNAYHFTDAYFDTYPFKEEYRLADEELRIVFQTGALAGMDFQVEFYDIGKYSYDDNTKNTKQIFEIIRNEDYGVELPSDTFHPAVGDEYVLYGFDQSKLTDMGYVEMAEQELLAAARKKIAELSIDPTVYNCATNPVRCAGYKMVGTKMAYDSTAAIDLSIGQSVELYSDNYFHATEGKRLSRVRSFEKKLANKYDAKYGIGQSAVYSRTQDLSEKVSALAISTTNLASTSGGSSVYLIKRYDSTTPTDYNAFSALRSRLEHASRINDDTIQGYYTFLKGLASQGLITAEQGARMGDLLCSAVYDSDIYAGQGWGVDKRGNAVFESVKIRSALEVLELIVNRLSASEGDQIFTESDTIESLELLSSEEVTYTDDEGEERTETIGTYGIHVKSKYDGYFTAMSEGMVLKGIFNNLPSVVGQGMVSGSGKYFTSWLRVNYVNSASNYFEAVMYKGAECPAGVNYAPCEMMKLARWGHQSDEEKQHTWYLSSDEGRIVFLDGVTKPIIDTENYAMILGRQPQWVVDMSKYMNDRDSYLYVKGIMTGFTETNPEMPSLLEERIVWAGQWDSDTVYWKRHRDERVWLDDAKTEENPDFNYGVTHQVTYMGCVWQCAKDLCQGSAPRYDNTDWAFVSGNPDFTIDFEEPEQLYFAEDLLISLTIIGKMHNQDVTADIEDSHVEWTRTTVGKDGLERTAADNAWALKFAADGRGGKHVELTIDDIGADSLNSAYDLKKIIFTATAYIDDTKVAAASIQI